MARRRSSNRNRYFDQRLWDAAGQDWDRVGWGLSRARVHELLADPEVPVGVHFMGEPLHWVPAEQRQQHWAVEVEPYFQSEQDDDGVEYRLRPDGTGAVATEWRRPGGQRLLLFEFLC